MRGSDYAELRAFAEVAGQGSFSRAAERLGMAPSTLSQTIRALEMRLDVTLLNRTTRRVSLTGAGARLLDRFAPAMAEIEAAVQDTRDQRLNLAAWFGCTCRAPHTTGMSSLRLAVWPKPFLR